MGNLFGEPGRGDFAPGGALGPGEQRKYAEWRYSRYFNDLQELKRRAGRARSTRKMRARSTRKMTAHPTRKMTAHPTRKMTAHPVPLQLGAEVAAACSAKSKMEKLALEKTPGEVKSADLTTATYYTILDEPHRTHKKLYFVLRTDKTVLKFNTSSDQNPFRKRRGGKLSHSEFLNMAIRKKATIYGKSVEAVTKSRRRLVALPLSTQEPLYGLPAIQPTETIHAVGNAGAEGMPLGQLAAIPIAIVLIGFTLVRSFKALLKRFRTPKKGKASTRGNDNGIT